MVTEIDRLMAMKAVQGTALHNLEKEEETGTESGEKERTGTRWLTTKLVFGWHFRERKWVRRARLVAREFKTQEHRTSLVRSHSWVTTGTFSVLHNSIDVKDAF